VVLLGFSMGGAVSIAIANEPVVEEVVGLAPWIPDQLDVSTLRRKRLAVFHGALDLGIRHVCSRGGTSPGRSAWPKET
jgi:dienelactone hydrolase